MDVIIDKDLRKYCEHILCVSHKQDYNYTRCSVPWDIKL